MTAKRAAAEPAIDRRVRRSRAALVAAFNQLVLDRGYEAISPTDVAALANVGRSTFYEHYAGIDDLLAQSLRGHLTALAEGGLKAEADPAVARVVRHFWDNRQVARTMLRGAAGAVVARQLTACFEATLEVGTPATPALPVKLLAAQLAAGQLALLEAWLTGRAPASADAVAHALQAGAFATVTALR